MHRAKERQKQNLLLLEGTNLISAACQVDYRLDVIFYTDRWQSNYPSLWANLREQNYSLQLVSSEVLKAIATTVNPDGIVAIAPLGCPLQPNISQTKLGLVLERLQDPGNLGTIIRSAVAVGVDGLWLSEDSVDLYHPKVLRASVGEWFRLPMATETDLEKLVKRYQQQGSQIIATSTQSVKTYWEVDYTRPSVILLGNEGAGLSPELIAIADEQVQIPLANGVESLNVAIASALLLYEAKRQWNGVNTQS